MAETVRCANGCGRDANPARVQRVGPIVHGYCDPCTFASDPAAFSYVDTYPSGREYVACGYPHVLADRGWRPCSRPVGHDEKHMNRDGNEWRTPRPRP